MFNRKKSKNAKNKKLEREEKKMETTAKSSRSHKLFQEKKKKSKDKMVHGPFSMKIEEARRYIIKYILPAPFTKWDL